MPALALAWTAAALALLLWGEWRSLRPLILVAKPLASAGFLSFAWAVGALHTTHGQRVTTALACGFVGDVLLMLHGRQTFLAGLVAFLLGHGVYAYAFAAQIDPGARAFAVLAGAGVFLMALAAVVHRWLVPKVPVALRLPVRGYIGVISLMVGLAAGAAAQPGPARWMQLVGAVMFYLSDLCVARQRFVRPARLNQMVGLPLYYGAQVLLALTCLQT